MSLPFQVHKLCSAEDLAALEEFAREPGRTIDQCHEWLQAHGYTLSRSAVGTWKKNFDLEDKFRQANSAARELLTAASEEKGTVAISDAVLLKTQQMIFEQLLRLQEDPDVPTKEIWALSMAAKNVVQGKRHNEKLKAEIADVLAAAEKDAASGKSGTDVVATIKRALGITGAAA